MGRNPRLPEADLWFESMIRLCSSGKLRYEQWYSQVSRGIESRLGIRVPKQRFTNLVNSWVSGGLISRNEISRKHVEYSPTPKLREMMEYGCSALGFLDLLKSWEVVRGLDLERRSKAFLRLMVLGQLSINVIDSKLSHFPPLKQWLVKRMESGLGRFREAIFQESRSDQVEKQFISSILGDLVGIWIKQDQDASKKLLLKLSS